MSFVHYDLTVSIDCLSFEFTSDGPKGSIKKVIHYSKLHAQGLSIYNLGFGDFNEATGKINDLSVTNNQDRDKVLGTVAKSFIHFFDKYPESRVVFMGSTPARTRLYVMEISKHWATIKGLVTIDGLTSHGWESFRQDRRYTALLITLKKS